MIVNSSQRYSAGAASGYLAQVSSLISYRHNVTMGDITMFQDQSAKPFVAHLKGNISSSFASPSEVVSAMSIFYHTKSSFGAIQYLNKQFIGNSNTNI